MLSVFKKSVYCLSVFALTACSEYYADEVRVPTEQEVSDYKAMHPQGAMKSGVFHMQRVSEGTSVRVDEDIILKRPDLPPFDVAYISRNVEAVLLELANAAGESIVMPEGLRARAVTVVHSGANFKEMLDIVLGKVGYHYNYVDGVWYITRYPIRSYALEIGQSDRRGSLQSDTELSPEDGENKTKISTGAQLDTDYNDQLWSQVETTLAEMIDVGKLATATQARSTASKGGVRVRTPRGKVVPTAAIAKTDDSQELFGELTTDGGLMPNRISGNRDSDHMQPEEDAKPWLKITRSAGLITVRAAPEAHRLIENYLERVQETSMKQVFVEVRIVAIERDHQTDRGANFTKDVDLGDTVLATLGFQSAAQLTTTNASGAFLSAFSQKSNGQRDMSAVLQALSSLGTVHTISSPSLLARNNQISRVSITRQLGYAETEVDQNTTSNGSVVIGTRTDSAKFKNEGTVLSLFPYIGKSRVQMRFRLSIASQIGDTEISTTVGAADTITNKVPELSNNLVDQDMVLEYGRVYAVGGLIETSTGVTRDYIPGLSDIPGLGEVFKRAASRKQDTEFIVFLRVTRS